MSGDKPLSRETLSAKLARTLREQILSRQYEPGDRLPTEPEMTTTYGVSRTVVRDAIEQLMREGLVIRRQGSGTYVSPPPPAPCLIEPVADLWDLLMPNGDPRHERTYAESDIADLLGIERGEHLYTVRHMATCRFTRRPVITKRIVPLPALAPITPAPDPFGPTAHLIKTLTDHYGPLARHDYYRALIPTGDQWPDLGITEATSGMETIRVTRTKATKPTALIAEVLLTCGPIRLSVPLPDVIGA